jgi:hypothetical protein
VTEVKDLLLKQGFPLELSQQENFLENMAHFSPAIAADSFQV